MELLGEDDIRRLVTRYAQLRVAFGKVLGEPELVQPTGRFFPDTFKLEPAAIAQMFARMRSYAPLAEGLAVELAFVEPEDSGGGCGSGGCGTGACAPGDKEKGKAPAAPPPSGFVQPLEEGYGVVLSTKDVGPAPVLAACLARATGTLVLHEAGMADEPGHDGAADGEVAAAVCGLGLLLLNGASVYSKGCGGLRARQATTHGVEEAALLTALFCRVHGRSPGDVRRHLEVTQGEAFADALRWVDSNPDIVEALRHHPEGLADGIFTLGPSRGFFARVFGRKPAPLGDAALAAGPPLKARPARVRAPEAEARLAETRALVEEALRDG